jgi:hypothetical protein
MELADLLAGHVGVPQRSLHDADDVEGPFRPGRSAGRGSRGARCRSAFHLWLPPPRPEPCEFHIRIGQQPHGLSSGFAVRRGPHSRRLGGPMDDNLLRRIGGVDQLDGQVVIFGEVTLGEDGSGK